MTTFGINFYLSEHDTLSGVLDIRMKVPMTRDIYEEMCRILEVRFHFLLTHMDQEGILEESAFCSLAFRDVLLAEEEVGSLFGEDAVVTLDRNLAFYQEAAMENLFSRKLTLQVGAPHRGEEGQVPLLDVSVHRSEWDFVPLAEGWDLLRE